jgi:hypothetical protein
MADENSNQTWEYLKEIGEAERHFNDIQARYRVLASTWLLASFAGIGFVLTRLEVPEEKDLFLCLIAAGGSIGVLIIWLLDILGYHRLLGAYFVEGLRIELENQNLPQIRWLMMDLGTVGSKARLFYFVCALAPVSTGLILLLPSLILNFDGQRLGQIVALGALLAIVFLTRTMTEDPKLRAKYTELITKRGSRQEMASRLHEDH